jgi:ribosomal protein S18 acetylase RimI-like enzyme
MIIRTYRRDDGREVSALWSEVFPNDPPHNAAAVAIPRKLAVQPELFFVAEEDGHVAGTIMAGYDGHRGWLYAVAVSPRLRRRGIGTALVQHAVSALAALGCLKVNLQVRAGNDSAVAFYRKLGFAVEERVSMGKRLKDVEER